MRGERPIFQGRPETIVRATLKDLDQLADPHSYEATYQTREYLTRRSELGGILIRTAPGFIGPGTDRTLTASSPTLEFVDVKMLQIYTTKAIEVYRGDLYVGELLANRMYEIICDPPSPLRLVARVSADSTAYDQTAQLLTPGQAIPGPGTYLGSWVSFSNPSAMKYGYQWCYRVTAAVFNTDMKLQGRFASQAGVIGVFDLSAVVDVDAVAFGTDIIGTMTVKPFQGQFRVWVDAVGAGSGATFAYNYLGAANHDNINTREDILTGVDNCYIRYFVDGRQTTT